MKSKYTWAQQETATDLLHRGGLHAGVGVVVFLCVNIAGGDIVDHIYQSCFFFPPPGGIHTGGSVDVTEKDGKQGELK